MKRCRESIELRADSLTYDNGPPLMPFPILCFFGFPFLFNPVLTSGYTTPMPHFWRKKRMFSRDSMGSFTLDRIGVRQRLRFDCGRERIEMGVLLSEPEREWLATELASW